MCTAIRAAEKTIVKKIMKEDLVSPVIETMLRFYKAEGIDCTQVVSILHLILKNEEDRNAVSDMFFNSNGGVYE
jgi:hypothetical protein